MLSNCVQEHLKCRICAHTRNARANEPPLNSTQTSEPLELICMDILDVGPSQSNFKYICVIVDHFTKYVVAEPVPNKSADAVAKVIVEKFILIYGTPKRMHSDRGKEFLNSTLSEISKILEIKHSLTAGYDPQANGLAERINQSLLHILKKSTASNWLWNERIAFAVFALNITPSNTTGYSPFALMFGRTARFPAEKTNFSVNPAYTIDCQSYIQLFRENIINMLEEAKLNSEKAQKLSKLWYDSRPKVSANKFAVGDRVMVAFPGMRQRATHKKLLWSHFGPYLIIEIGASSANLVPVDKKKETPITVPIERLIKVPASVPNISTLPKGRNPYKNELKLMCLYASLLSERGEKPNEKVAKKVVVAQLRTIAQCKWGKAVERENKMEGIQEKMEKMCLGKAGNSGWKGHFSGIKWTSICGSEGHELCGPPLHMHKLDPALEDTELGTRIVQTPMQALLAAFILRSGTVASMTAARTFVGNILESGPKMELCAFIGKRGDFIASGKLPLEEDQLKALEHWVGTCMVAREALTKSAFGPLAMGPPEGFNEIREEDRSEWKTIFDETAWILEKVRAQMVHRAEKFIVHPRVFVGDSSAHQLQPFFDQSIHIGPKEGSIAEIIRAFKPVVLSSRVKVIVVLAGRDSLVQGETADAIADQFRLLSGLCRRFPIPILWSCPPYVHLKQHEFETLIARMQPIINAPPAIQPICTTNTGRSALEIFRFGDGFNQHLVQENGVMKNAGCRALKAWMTTQTPFPGNLEMGIRTVHSVAVVPTDNRVDVPRVTTSFDISGNRADFHQVNRSYPPGNRADSRRVENRPGSASRFRPYPSDRGRLRRPSDHSRGHNR